MKPGTIQTESQIPLRSQTPCLETCQWFIQSRNQCWGGRKLRRVPVFGSDLPRSRTHFRVPCGHHGTVGFISDNHCAFEILSSFSSRNKHTKRMTYVFSYSGVDSEQSTTEYISNFSPAEAKLSNAARQRFILKESVRERLKIPFKLIKWINCCYSVRKALRYKKALTCRNMQHKANIQYFWYFTALSLCVYIQKRAKYKA